MAGNLYSTGALYEHCVTVTRLYRGGPICNTVTTATYCSLLYSPIQYLSVLQMHRGSQYPHHAIQNGRWRHWYICMCLIKWNDQGKEVDLARVHCPGWRKFLIHECKRLEQKDTVIPKTGFNTNGHIHHKVRYIPKLWLSIQKTSSLSYWSKMLIGRSSKG